MVVQGDPGDPDSVGVMAAGSVAGHEVMFRLDTGAARSQVLADAELAELTPVESRRSAGAFGEHLSMDVVRIRDLAVGDLAVAELDVDRMPADSGQQYLLGMDVLGRYCCRFRFDAGVLELDDSRDPKADLELILGDRGHPYVELTWDGVTASALWDSGSGITVVDQGFLDRNPGLFVAAGVSIGTDSTGAQFSTPMFEMAGPAIGGVRFPAARAVVVDLGPVNRELQYPMDVIVGAPLIRQANWLLDFPARRWAAPEVLLGL
jgi:hypothetical protein